MDLRLKGYEDVKQSEMNKGYDIMISLFFGFQTGHFCTLNNYPLL